MGFCAVKWVTDLMISRLGIKHQGTTPKGQTNVLEEDFKH